jgi:hypothetical protein
MKSLRRAARFIHERGVYARRRALADCSVVQSGILLILQLLQFEMPFDEPDE